MEASRLRLRGVYHRSWEEMESGMKRSEEVEVEPVRIVRGGRAEEVRGRGTEGPRTEGPDEVVVEDQASRSFCRISRYREICIAPRNLTRRCCLSPAYPVLDHTCRLKLIVSMCRSRFRRNVRLGKLYLHNWRLVEEGAKNRSTLPPSVPCPEESLLGRPVGITMSLVEPSGLCQIIKLVTECAHWLETVINFGRENKSSAESND